MDSNKVSSDDKPQDWYIAIVHWYCKSGTVVVHTLTVLRINKGVMLVKKSSSRVNGKVIQLN